MSRPDEPMIVRDVNARELTRVNKAFSDRMGYAVDELAQRPLLSWIHAADRKAFQEILDVGHGMISARHQSRATEWEPLEWRVKTAAGSEPTVFGTLRNPDAPSREASDSSFPDGDTMVEVLRAAALMVEEQHPGMKCSILLMDSGGESVRVGAGPSLPPDYNAAIEGLKIGPGVGSCGTAAFWNERVIVDDIQSDPLWINLRQHAAMAGVGSCWSHPLTDKNGAVVGAMALYDRAPRKPTHAELDNLEATARFVGLVVERGQVEHALRVSESSSQRQSKLLAAVTEVVTSFVDSGDWCIAGRRLVAAALDFTGADYGFLGMVHNRYESPISFESVAFQGRLEATPVDRGSDRELESKVFASLESQFRDVVTSRATVVRREFQPTRNVLCAPISNAEGVVAVVCIVNSGGSFSNADHWAVEKLCHVGHGLIESHRRQQRQAELERQLHESGKTEALGVLAGAVAHDLNNMHTTVLGNVELAMMQLGSASEAVPALNDAVTACLRATGLCNQMLAYGGRGVFATQHVECNGLVTELGRLLRVAVPKKAVLEYVLFDEDLHVEADNTQLQQVIMNLITNAAESLGNELGVVTVGTGVRVYSAEELQNLSPDSNLAGGEFVHVTVTDTGVGMDSGTREKIFDPFFTTKSKGRGLGLAAVQRIIRRHGGVIRVETAPTRGTTFTVLLPRVAAPVVSANRTPLESTPASVGKRIMVVDDEPEVQQTLTSILQHAGFDVICASDGEEAIRVFRREGHEIDCVLLDWCMPKLDGEETLKAMREIRADVCVVLSSGFAEQEILERFDGAGLAGVVHKPSPSRVLIEKVELAIRGVGV